MENKVITFEIAKLAKDCGFNLKTEYYYNSDNPLSDNVKLLKNYFGDGEEVNSVWFNEEVHEETRIKMFKLIPHNQAPTYKILNDWLKENKGIYVGSITENLMLSLLKDLKYILNDVK